MWPILSVPGVTWGHPGLLFLPTSRGNHSRKSSPYLPGPCFFFQPVWSQSHLKQLLFVLSLLTGAIASAMGARGKNQAVPVGTWLEHFPSLFLSFCWWWLTRCLTRHQHLEISLHNKKGNNPQREKQGRKSVLCCNRRTERPQRLQARRPEDGTGLPSSEWPNHCVLFPLGGVPW